jgi:hypothetical protein
MESTHNEGVAVGSRLSRMSHGAKFGTMLTISCLLRYDSSRASLRVSILYLTTMTARGMWAV